MEELLLSYEIYEKSAKKCELITFWNAITESILVRGEVEKRERPMAPFIEI